MVKSLEGKRVLVVGLARSGLAAARFLAARRAIVTVSDSRPPSAFAAEMRELVALKAGAELGAHREKTFLEQDLVVVSPGIRWDFAPLAAARRKGIAVIPEIELAGWFGRGRIIGVTGSNGKTTTTVLIGKILEASGFHTLVAGNVGVPLISVVGQMTDASIAVVELSSFQLEAIESFHPHVAMLLNLSPNHLDRHPSFEAYIQAKARIFRNQRADDVAVLNADDDRVRALAPNLQARKIWFSRRRELIEGLFIADGRIFYRTGGLERLIMEANEVRLRGEFNLENVLAAAGAAAAVGSDFGAIRSVSRQFAGVEHRLEFVREVRGVSFYNDSKATSVDAASKAVATFSQGVHLILGGTHKGAPYRPLRPLLRGRVREVLAIGAAADTIARDLEGAVEIVRAGTLEAALGEAFRRATPGDAILLSPACSSYDQFHDFEERGRAFKDLVAKLAMEPEPAAAWALDPPVAVEGNERKDQPAPSVASAEAAREAGSASRGVPPEGAVEISRRHSEDATVEPARATADVKQEAATPTSKLHELEYVFEVSAEEIPRAESDDPEVGLAQEAAFADDLGPRESPTDEALAYEVRTREEQ